MNCSNKRLTYLLQNTQTAINKVKCKIEACFESIFLLLNESNSSELVRYSFDRPNQTLQTIDSLQMFTVIFKKQ